MITTSHLYLWLTHLPVGMFSPVGMSGNFPFVPRPMGMSIQFPNSGQEQQSRAEATLKQENDRKGIAFANRSKRRLQSLMAGPVGAWDNFLSGLAEEPRSLEQVQPAPTQISEEQQRHRVVDPAEQDSLARTAGQLVEALREEQNPKFKNSQFMGLMRSLADKTSVVEGSDIVLAPSTSENTVSSSADVKGKGKERASTIDAFGQTARVYPYYANLGMSSGGQPTLLSQPQGQAPDTATTSDVTQDPHDEVYEYFRQENEDYIAYNQAANRVAAADTQGLWDDSSRQYEWDKLQDEWDAWEANAVGVRKMSNYQFAAENPYLLGSSTRVHDMHYSFDQVSVPMRITESVDSDPWLRQSATLTSSAIADEHPGTRGFCAAGSQECPSVVCPGCETARQRTGAEGY